jgi:hypothetical protein
MECSMETLSRGKTPSPLKSTSHGYTTGPSHLWIFWLCGLECVIIHTKSQVHYTPLREYGNSCF